MYRVEELLVAVRHALCRLVGWSVDRALRLSVLAVVIRVVLAVVVDGHGQDRETYRGWGRALRTHPVADFYAVVPDADHLPGDLWLHALLARAANPDSAAYPLLLKGVPILADLVIAAAMMSLVGWLVGSRAGRATALAYLWCPAPIVVGAVWGQWDHVSIAALLGAVTIAVRSPRRLPLAAAPAAWAVLMKPQLVIGVAVLLVVGVPGRRLATTLARGVIPALATTVLVCGPFQVGILGARWSLADRLAVVADRYTGVSLGAPNLWSVVMPGWHLDDERLLGIPARLLGHVLLGLVVAAAVLLALRAIRAGRTRRATAGAWTVMIALGGFFLLETRNHERYVMPWLVASILWVGVAGPARLRRALPIAVFGLSTAVALITALGWLWPVDWRDPTYRTIAAIYLAVFAWLLGCSGGAGPGRGGQLDLRHGQTQDRAAARRGFDGVVGADRPVRGDPAGARGAGRLSG